MSLIAFNSVEVALDNALVAEGAELLQLALTHSTAGGGEVLQDWLTSDDRDITNTRMALEADARRLGCVLVFGHLGAPVRELAPDLRETVRELERRLAALEA